MIDYKKLSDGAEYYSNLGYLQIEVPWATPKTIIDITMPKTKKADPWHGMFLVGSAEQSFLWLSALKSLPVGRFQAITPCFRDEEGEDFWHYSYFMKLELFINDFPDDYHLTKVINDAQGFFNKYIKTKVKQTSENSFDIVDANKGVELGSYSIGEHELIGKWLCGTGVAEPRLSEVISRCK